MKDSGIEWIGASFQNENSVSERSERQIPEDWKMSKIKYNGEFRNGLTYSPQDLCDENEGTLVLRSSNIKDGCMAFDDNVYVKCPIDSKSIIKKNDILICSRNGSKELIGKNAIYDKDEKMAFGAFMMIYRCNNPRYMYFVLNSNIFKENIGLFSTSTVNQLTGSVFGNIKFPLPPLETQKRIADFLEGKCGKIDSLKSDIQKQIETLEQYKKSVITEAVTKGINPDAKMKDSGIEWIGEIPEHWEIHPVYYYFEERKHKNTLCKEENLLSLSYGNVIRKDINALGGLLPESFNTYNIIEKNDIVIRPTDLQNDKRSLRTGLCKEHGIITSAYITLMPKKNVNSEYFHYLLHSYDIEKVFYNMGNGVRQGLNYSEFAKLLIISPTHEEQKQIADYLDAKCSKIDSIIASKKQQLETLEEYKKSLIFEYVTGKKEV